MRYCKECGSIFENKGNVCVNCGTKTEDIGLDSGQLELFPETEIDRVKSIYSHLKKALGDAHESVTKATRALRKKEAERAAAATALINYDKLVKSQDFNDLSGEVVIYPELPGPSEGDAEEADDDDIKTINAELEGE